MVISFFKPIDFGLETIKITTTFYILLEKTHGLIGSQRGLNLKDIFHMIKRWYLMNCKRAHLYEKSYLDMENKWELRRKRMVTPDHFFF